MAFGDTIQTKSAQSSGTSVGLVFDSGPTQGNLLVCVAYSSSSGTITCDSSGWAEFVTSISPSRGRCSWWWKIAGASESASLDFTVPASNPATIVGGEFAGPFAGSVDQTSSNSATSGTAHSSGAFTPASGDVLLVGGSAGWSNITFSAPGSGWSIAAQSAQANASAHLQKSVTTGGSSKTMTATASGSTWWAAAAASFVAAAAGAPQLVMNQGRAFRW